MHARQGGATAQRAGRGSVFLGGSDSPQFVEEVEKDVDREAPGGGTHWADRRQREPVSVRVEIEVPRAASQESARGVPRPWPGPWRLRLERRACNRVVHDHDLAVERAVEQFASRSRPRWQDATAGRDL